MEDARQIIDPVKRAEKLDKDIREAWLKQSSGKELVVGKEEDEDSGAEEKV